MNNLSITNVSKTYSNGVRALKNVSLEISAGMFGLLGPNGAGKSSLMRTIATLQEPDGGSVKLGELDVLTQKQEVRKMLGYLPQEFGVYPKISAEVLLDHLAVLKGLTNAGERREVVKALLHKTNLYEARKKNLGGYSGGMKQRFGIAQALLANPKLIIVDEPTAGLDPAERNRFHNVLCEVGENAIVILSTHIVEDVKELCTQMAIINKGEVLLTGSPQEAIKEVQGKIYRKIIYKSELDAYKKEHEVISERLLQGKPVIHIYSEGDPGQGFEPVEAELSDVYFSRIFGDR
ncbi:ABC transporter ATP-binding protein [Fulvivirga kasyanovii]|uniref:ABC transporter ATP-binding protein n=1 Tax=Fulvivirga kasyanovii TaxID=396812 RepID=A0ABW9RRR2_9BACT|nr:ABC transporter ATP-binding protein [Fulvivirga kasyanovii]MTI26864.1 ABC transporter ATP-binding protein [Fulvivirga kasyanovii]